MRTTLVALAVAFVAAACGGSSGSSGDGPRTLNSLSQNVSAAAEAYGIQASSMTDPMSCNADESSYDAQLRPMVEQMQAMAPGMDQSMSSMGHGDDADMACAANAMMAELDRHKGVACSSTTDMGPNKTEAQNHVAFMTQWADHQIVRSDEMGSMMGTGGMGGEMKTGHCVHNADGTYTMH